MLYTVLYINMHFSNFRLYCAVTDMCWTWTLELASSRCILVGCIVGLVMTCTCRRLVLVLFFQLIVRIYLEVKSMTSLLFAFFVSLVSRHRLRYMCSSFNWLYVYIILSQINDIVIFCFFQWTIISLGFAICWCSLSLTGRGRRRWWRRRWWW